MNIFETNRKGGPYESINHIVVVSSGEIAYRIRTAGNAIWESAKIAEHGHGLVVAS